MPTSGEVRINGAQVFGHNEKPPETLKCQPPVVYQEREAGAVRHTATGPTHPLKSGLTGKALTHKVSTGKHLSVPADGPRALAPGAAAAVQAALGKDGPKRIGRILTAPGDRFSAGTHTRSGYLKDKDGKLILDKKGHKIPYGCAFDVSVAGKTSPQAKAMARALRLEGIVAWYRAPGSEGGKAGSGAHIHCVWPGAPTDNEQNEQQISSFVQGYQGLANGRKPKNEWVDHSIMPDEVKAVEAAYDQGGHAKSLDHVTSYDEKHFPFPKKRKR